MKKIFLYGVIALASGAMVSCDDFLDDNRYPLTSQMNNPEYWNNASNVENQVNYYYSDFVGYGNAGGTGDFYFQTLSDDQAGNGFTNWKNVNVPTTSSNWSSPYTEIRRASYVITNVRTSSLTPKEKANYEGIARLHRARQYFELVQKYGDVQWIDDVVEISDDAVVYGARDDRDIVMDSVLQDLNFAAAAISTQSSKTTWSKDLAQAIKADVCLYEGTYCRYRTEAENGKAPNEDRAKKYLQECVNACEAVMGSYTISDDYQALYNSLSLDNNPEIIFYKEYKDNILMHSLIAYISSSTQISGMTKDAFDAYLFKDGKPLAHTTLDKNDCGKVVDGEYRIDEVLAVRDARLSATIDPVIYYQDMPWARDGGNNMTSSTGYGCKKYDNVTIPVASRVNTTKNYTCAPLYWLSVIYLNYAEAKAELGQLTQADVNNTIGKLYTRAELPVLDINNIQADPANNMGVSNLLWEIRRCRRCELMFDRDNRYWDLVRWHQLHLLDSQNYPNILLGANMTAAPVDIDNVGGYVDGSKGKIRVYDNRQYLYPIPSGQRQLNENLTQNPLWVSAEN